MSLLYIQANHVTKGLADGNTDAEAAAMSQLMAKQKQTSSTASISSHMPAKTHSKSVRLSKQDKDIIEQIKEQYSDRLFQILVHSLCPTIYGQEAVKVFKKKHKMSIYIAKIVQPH